MCATKSNETHLGVGGEFMPCKKIKNLGLSVLIDITTTTASLAERIYDDVILKGVITCDLAQS